MSDTVLSNTPRPAATGDIGVAPADRAIGLWLLVMAAMVTAMVVIGGITRLTESGLSMVEWRPLIGAFPPLSEAEWQRVFDLYRQTSEYRLQNAGMSLAEFQTIFWWEFIHRVWGRLLGAVFVLPFLWFLVRGRVRRGLLPHLVALLALGGLQGWLGWWMVQSGFVDRTDVSQYRLVTHLGMALGILCYLTVLGLRLRYPASDTAPSVGHRRAACGLVALVFVTALSGGFVAGLDGGLVYNSFPTMNGDWVPEDYWGLGPAWLNPFENPSAAQLHHRVIAVATVLVVWFAAWRFLAAGAALPAAMRRGIAVAAVIAALQAGLGIATLLAQVPLVLGIAHQAGAVLLLLSVLYVAARADPRTKS